MPTETTFPRARDTAELETGTIFTPRFDTDGLIPAIVTDADDGSVLMFAWMNREALQLSLKTRQAHFWTRSRKKIWLKGEESGNILNIETVAVDCDQDVLLVRARLAGARIACHTGQRSCFYRSVDLEPGSDGTYGLKMRPGGTLG